MQNVVAAVECVRTFDDQYVTRLFNDAEYAMVTARVAADVANLVLGQIEALATRSDACLDCSDRVRQFECFGFVGHQHMLSESLGRLPADPR